MKFFLSFFCFLIFITQIKSQCFEIESILVDACDGGNEGQNEMVTFKVGASPLNASNLTADWASTNVWRGICSNAGTAADIASVNSTIINCGYLKEPTAGILPANSKVLLITGTSWNPSAQSFANLSDTIYVIFQCFNTGNTGGHFANHTSATTPSVAIRTFSMSFSSTCKDAVTYDRNNLLKQNLTTGAEDGATVEFTPSGIATYVNNGCKAPVTLLSVDAGLNNTVCGNSSQSFTATILGSYSSVNWSLGSGAMGILTNQNSLNTTYTPGVGETGTVKLYCSVIKSCGGPQSTIVKDSVNLLITPVPTISVNNANVSLCAGQSATVTAISSTGTYTWSPINVFTNTLVVTGTDVYTVSTSNSCGSASVIINVLSPALPTATLASTSSSLCISGQTAVLSVLGSSGTYLWNNGIITPTTSVSLPGVYSVTVTTPSCGNAIASYTIDAIPNPTLSITSTNTMLCNGSTAILTATSNFANYLWSNGSVNTQSISVLNSGIYTVQVSNVCAVEIKSITIQTLTTPVLSITTSSTSICSNEIATLTVTGGENPYQWSNSSITGSVVTTTGGTVSVTNTNVCGSATQTIEISVIAVDASIIANPTSGVGPLLVDFINNSSGAINYNWILGNGNLANTQTVTSQTYSVVGTYKVYLIVNDGNCFDTDSIEISVLNQEPTIIVPNVFTPNADLVNDVFKVTAINITQFNCTIFDRWGIKLYEWDDIKNGWDGKVDGKLASDGTYFYIINAIDFDKKELKKQGSFTLFK